LAEGLIKPAYRKEISSASCVLSGMGILDSFPDDRKVAWQQRKLRRKSYLSMDDAAFYCSVAQYHVLD
jgi:hypothetical protein